MQNGIALTPRSSNGRSSRRQRRHGQLGRAHTSPHCSAAWAWAGNTPFQWGKQVASHLGGSATRWPCRGRGTSPTPAAFAPNSPTSSTSARPSSTSPASPTRVSVDGIDQAPMQGTSLAYTFDDAATPSSGTPSSTSRCTATAASTRTAGGPRPCCRGSRGTPPRPRSPSSPPTFLDPDALPWELYYLPDDFSQAHDLAAQHPDKVAELDALWWEEAEANLRHPAAGRTVSVLRHRPAAGHEDPMDLLGRRRAERARRDRTADPQPVLLHHRDVDIPEHGDRRGSRRGVRPPRRLQPVRHGRQTAPHLQLHGRRDLPTSSPTPPSRPAASSYAWTSTPTHPSWAPPAPSPVRQRATHRHRPHRPHRPHPLQRLRRLDIGRDNGEVVDTRYEAKAPFPFTGTIHSVIYDVRPPGQPTTTPSTKPTPPPPTPDTSNPDPNPWCWLERHGFGQLPTPEGSARNEPGPATAKLVGLDLTDSRHCDSQRPRLVWRATVVRSVSATCSGCSSHGSWPASAMVTTSRFTLSPNRRNASAGREISRTADDEDGVSIHLSVHRMTDRSTRACGLHRPSPRATLIVMVGEPRQRELLHFLCFGPESRGHRVHRGALAAEPSVARAERARSASRQGFRNGPESGTTPPTRSGCASTNEQTRFAPNECPIRTTQS